MNKVDLKATFQKPAVMSLGMLLVGLSLGLAGEKFLARGAVPETVPAVDARSPSSGTLPFPVPDTLFPGADDPWDPFREMRDLQAEMDQMFQRSISRFQLSPAMDPFKNDTGYSLSLDVRELKDRYEVRAWLPDAKASDANVKLEGNRLEVAVTNHPTTGQQNINSPVQTEAWGQYTQEVELAGKLNSSQMKVDHQNHELLITIPKA